MYVCMKATGRNELSARLLCVTCAQLLGPELVHFLPATGGRVLHGGELLLLLLYCSQSRCSGILDFFSA